jgi:hypothetical protein
MIQLTLRDTPRAEDIDSSRSKTEMANTAVNVPMWDNLSFFWECAGYSENGDLSR